MSNIISGKSGTLKIGVTPAEVANVAMWTMAAKGVENAHASNSTQGWKTRSFGVLDATGKIKIYCVDDADPGVLLGTSYPVQLHTDDSGNNYYSGSIMLTAFDGLSVDMNDGKECFVEYSWGANGKLTPNGDVPAFDTAAA